jgi:hypothetical protein
MTRSFLAGWTITAALIFAAATGCPPAAVAPTIDFTTCALNVDKGEPAGTGVLVIIADVLVACGGDVLSIIQALSSAHASDPVMLAALDAAKAEFTANPVAFKAKLAAHATDGGR